MSTSDGFLCLTTPLTDAGRRFDQEGFSSLFVFDCFLLFLGLFSSMETGIKRTCQL